MEVLVNFLNAVHFFLHRWFKKKLYVQFSMILFLVFGAGSMVRLYRSRDEIIFDILKAASYGAKKTHIMQRANLNPSMFHKYFPTLLENGLLVERDDPDGGVLYEVSDEGREFLKMYRSLQARFRKKVEEPPYVLK